MGTKASLTRANRGETTPARAAVAVPVVSAIIPCLNEEASIGICVAKALDAFARRGIAGEVVVGDNGSTDRSVEIAEALGARVVHQPVKGYGAAITAAAGAARGQYLIMADADDSYDWSQLDHFIDALEDGAELVMGNRFAGGIEAGAMPPLHRYLGNPVLSAVARWLHRSPIRDFHCGMRGFTREAFKKMGARSPGMEFASEMVINAHRAGLDIREVPIKLYPDKRGRPPHLRSFRDGWRHLRLIIAHAPDTMYLLPGLLLLLAGITGLAMLATGPVTIAGQYFGIHFVALSSMATLIGLCAILLGALAKVAIAIYHSARSRGAMAEAWPPARMARRRRRARDVARVCSRRPVGVQMDFRRRPDGTVGSPGLRGDHGMRRRRHDGPVRIRPEAAARQSG
jgi:hypothetical protein